MNKMPQVRRVLFCNLLVGKRNFTETMNKILYTKKQLRSVTVLWRQHKAPRKTKFTRKGRGKNYPQVESDC